MSKQSSSPAQPLRVLILSDGKMGDLGQCRGVALALAATVEEILVEASAMPAVFAAVRADRGFVSALDALAAPPHVIIASGRRTLPYLKLAKSHFGQKPLSVFLKDPRTGSKAADLIWVPTHDGLRGSNVITSDTGPHGFTAERRQGGATALQARLEDLALPRPWLGMLLGGPTRKMPFDAATIAAFLDAARLASKGSGAVLVTASRRTPPELLDALADIHPRVWLWDGTGDNPYVGLLGACDAFLVTGDSHNMVSEALCVGRHTMVFRPKGLPSKFVRFLDGLETKGLVTPPMQADTSRQQATLDSTGDIASAILAALQARAHQAPHCAAPTA
jgi:uncharacterized protein